MKALLITSIFIIMGLNMNDKLKGSIWICKIAPGCVDTLKFKSNNQITEYSCEQEYTYHGSYTLLKDTLTITEKDDSHSEDHEKVTYYKTKYLITKSTLLPIFSGELVKGKWKYKSLKPNTKNVYKRLN